jgi:hypothetical protein
MTTSNGPIEIIWSAPEFHFYHKTPMWYWGVGGVAALIIGFSIWQQNFLFALFAIIAAILVIVWASRQPKTIDFKLTDKGLMLNDVLEYPFEKLEGFAIIPVIDDPELEELVLRTKSNLHHWVKVIIATQRKDTIYEFLNEHIHELEYEESLTDHIGKIFKF